ncbi:MAG: hypothetical protein RMK29_01910 [Myxococcales bacterium]|nr:hypothetical protein [Myxococcota bacterium]MDW8280436.1 hypothetical protein [Myxococcales bacterium]
MWKLLMAGALGAVVLSESGCMYITAVRSVQGKAFVVKASPFGGSFWNCDATSGEPVCYRVTEVPLSAAK